MERNRRNFLNKHSNPQFKKIGGPRKGKLHHSVREPSSDNFPSSDTVYRILCQSKKIGSVIGKGGSIVKVLREETQAKITVSDSVPGSDERVIIIFSPSDKQAQRQRGNNGNGSEKGYDAMEPCCAAQGALLKVHDRIIEEDLGGREKGNGDETVVCARLLVSNNMVGCILGRKGDVIQRLRSETSANIRILPPDHLPACAMSNDELVQISGKPAIAKKALYEISTLLHQNAWKDTTPLHTPIPYASQGFHPPGRPIRNMLPPENSAWLERTADTHKMQSLSFKGGYGIHPSAVGAEDLDGVAPHDQEARSEFTMKILCSADRIGGVIGKGGTNVRQLEQETGASIHVENVSRESDEKVIRVSSFEALLDQRSQTIDAILHLQNRTSEFSDEGTITTRLLVLSSKVGCILGQGGQVINDMRRRTHADIRVFSKEDKPTCASEDEELVQISGSCGIAKDALVEVASRIRTRYLRNASATEETASIRPLPGFGPTGNLRGGSFPRSSTVGAGSLGRYDHLQGSVREFESPSFPVPPHASGYLDANEANVSLLATGGGHMAEFAGTRMKLLDPHSSGSDFGTTDHFSSSRNVYHIATASSAGPNNHPHPGAYHGYNSQQGVYRSNIDSPVPYQNHDPRPVPYQKLYTQLDLYQNIGAHGSYQY